MNEKQTTESSHFSELIKKWRSIQRPGIQHDLFKQMTGRWDVDLIFYAKGQSWKSKCIANNELLHGGRFLIEQINGEIYAPDDCGNMEKEPYSSTRILAYDNYKKAYCGSFAENQNSYILNFTGRKPLSEKSNQIVFFGLADEPMLEINDTTMKYILDVEKKNIYKWKVFALALGENAMFLEYIFRK